jgi:broad specificity phosphatase PhoE
MSKLYYITHPEVKIDPQIAIEDWNLSQIGRTKAINISKEPFWKDIDLIITSPEMKAQTTAKIISEKTKVPVIKKDCLAEFDRSSTGFLKYEKYMEYMNKFYTTPDQSIDGWETALDAQTRIINCIDEFIKDEKYNNIAVIGHGATATLYKCFIKQIAPSFDEDPKAQGKYFVVDLDSNTLVSDWKSY